MSTKLIISKREKSDLLLDTDLSSNGFITRNFEIFKKIICNLSDLVEGLNFIMDEDGLRFSTMDNSHISYIKCNFPDDFFDYYKCDKNSTYGIPLKHLNKIFSITNYNMDMKMVFSDDDVIIEFMDGSSHKIYNLKLMDIDDESLEIPDIEDTFKICMDSKEFYHVCKEINDIGNVLNIKTLNDNKKIEFSSEGEFTNLKIIKNNNIDFDESIDISFDSKYLLNFSKCFSISKNVSLKISVDRPLKIRYELIRDADIIYYIAPKINEN